VKEIRRKDNRGVMRVIPAQNVVGQHGRTAIFVGFDEIHGYRNWDLLEALAPGPTRADTLTWITSYDSIYDIEGCVSRSEADRHGRHRSADAVLLVQRRLLQRSEFRESTAGRACQSIDGLMAGGKAYIDQQPRRLPSAKFRRLHLNSPGAPSGAHFDQGRVEAAIVSGRQVIEPQDGLVFTKATYR
jgi:hypothetical protein